MTDLVISRLEAAVLLDSKVWQERKKHGPDRPLRKFKHKVLSDEAIFEFVRVQQGFATLGEARDLVGKELRIRLRESGHG